MADFPSRFQSPRKQAWWAQPAQLTSEDRPAGRMRKLLTKSVRTLEENAKNSLPILYPVAGISILVGLHSADPLAARTVVAPHCT
jgi:TRAP-type uncharacterized transport system fused permease subunit